MRDPSSDPNARLPAIAFLQPVYGHPPPSAVISVERLIATNVAKRLFVDVQHELGTYIGAARNILVEKALRGANNPTHVLFVDQDMTIPLDAPARLAAHNQPVVGATYFLRGDPFTPVAYNFKPDYHMLPRLPRRKLQRVGGVGMGCTLIDVEVFGKLEAHFGDRQWFHQSETMGEDVWFAHRCREAGIPIHLDTTVRCGHVGDVEVSHEQYAFALAARKGRGETIPQEELARRNRGRY